MNLMKLRTAIGIGAMALTLAGGATLAGAEGGAQPAGADGVGRTASGVPTCQGVPATIVFQPGQFSLEGTDNRDVVVGTRGANNFKGHGGDDLVCLGGGNDSYFPGREVNGSDGNDEVYGGGGDDFFAGGKGNDKLFGGGGADRFFAHDGTDLCHGGKGTDSFYSASEECEVVVSIP